MPALANFAATIAPGHGDTTPDYPDQYPVVRTDGGLVRGEAKAMVTSFKGIPYAAAPIDDLRWKAPQPVEGWAGVRDATEFGGSCTQGTGWDPGYDEPTLNEDCLYLNVYRPSNAKNKKLPVLVWNHGGGNQGGAGRDTNPSRFVTRQDVVYVTINYRLGATGYLMTPSLDSRYPRVSDGTLVPTLPREALGFPQIPGVAYTGWINPVHLVDRASEPWTKVPGTDYDVLAPKTDADGNDLGGIRTVDVQAPLGTYTGWALNKAGFAENEDCQLAGQFIPFAETREERTAADDPRPSLEERYPSHGAYVKQVVRAANGLVREGFLLRHDAEEIKGSAAEAKPGLPR